MKRYTVSIDNLSKGVSIFIVLLFTGLTAHQVYALLYRERGEPLWVFILIVGIQVSILLITFLYKIDGYLLEQESLVIERPIGNKIFPFNEIKNVEVPTKESMRWTIRTVGNGGLFGYWGSFTNTTYGNMTWYATRRSNYILVRLKDGTKIIITPDDMNLATELKSKLN